MDIYPRSYKGIPRARRKHFRELLGLLTINDSVLMSSRDLRAMLAVAAHDNVVINWRECWDQAFKVSRAKCNTL